MRGGLFYSHDWIMSDGKGKVIIMAVIVFTYMRLHLCGLEKDPPAGFKEMICYL